MTTLTFPEDGSRLSELIDRVLAGDDVLVSRQGRPVVALRPVAAGAAEPRRVSKEGAAWLRANRVPGRVPEEDAGTFISRMRDEDVH
jgi:prevent-host-death family protein